MNRKGKERRRRKEPHRSQRPRGKSRPSKKLPESSTNERSLANVILGSFARQLELLCALSEAENGKPSLDPEILGEDIAQSFIIGLRVALASRDCKALELPNVGTLRVEKGMVSISREEKPASSDPQSTTDATPLLKTVLSSDWTDLLDLEVIEKVRFWQGEGLETVFRKRSEPLPGHSLLAALAACARMASEGQTTSKHTAAHRQI
jgi:hypothetical protein